MLQTLLPKKKWWWGVRGFGTCFLGISGGFGDFPERFKKLGDLGLHTKGFRKAPREFNKVSWWFQRIQGFKMGISLPKSTLNFPEIKWNHLKQSDQSEILCRLWNHFPKNIVGSSLNLPVTSIKPWTHCSGYSNETASNTSNYSYAP